MTSSYENLKVVRPVLGEERKNPSLSGIPIITPISKKGNKMKTSNVASAQSTADSCPFNTVLWRAMLLALAILPTGCNKSDQEESQPPATQNVQPASPAPQTIPPPQATAPTNKPLTDLESLVAPIALYPDPLLAELLVASTYPFEVVQAARWLETQPDLATLSSKDWDASIMRLVSVPTVIKMMNDHLDWTSQLGDTFLAKPADVMTSIQALRKRAREAGYLKDTPEQKVEAQTVALESAPAAADAVIQPAVLKKEVITIKPAKSDTVYVPQYNPEVVYQAPMAPPPAAAPASTVVNVNAASPVPSYYPTYYPAPATTTTTSNDSWMSFASGALVGGLLTWGIMEWADDDDWDGYHVSHYYGNSVCHNGNCWHGGGGYYGDRGNINYNKNIDISGNEINIDRGGNFSQANLKPSQQPARWQSNPRHRRGQPYPPAAQQRLGRTQQPALAGQRLGASQVLPASVRGFTETERQRTAGTLPSGQRPSSADIQRQLAQGRPATRDNALQGLTTSGQTSRLQSQRGAASRKLTAPRTLENQAHKPLAGSAQTKRQAAPVLNQSFRPGQAQSQPARTARRGESFAGVERGWQQQGMAQRRTETARPNAFEAPHNASATQSFSQRGSFSMQRSTSAGNFRTSGNRGSGGFRSGGGGGGRGDRRR